MTLEKKFAAKHADEFERFKTEQEEIQAREDAKLKAELKATAIRVRKEFSSRLKAARLAAGMTQTEVARKSRVNQVTVSAYESGRIDPSLSVLVSLCEILKVSPNELLGWEPCT